MKKDQKNVTAVRIVLMRQGLLGVVCQAIGEAVQSRFETATLRKGWGKDLYQIFRGE